MGGTVKKLTSPIGDISSGLLTGGLSQVAKKNLSSSNFLNQSLNLGGTISDKINGKINSTLFPDKNLNGSGTASDPFYLDPNQMASDLKAINDTGEKQYQETINAAPQVVSNTLAQVLPNIAEDYNAGHVLNSSAYPQEVARQASNLTKNLVLPAIQARQGYQTGALQRGLSLEDFVNQANVAKQIGAQFAPQVGNGKGTSVAGLGSGAAAGSAFGPWGAAIGGGLGYLGGGGLNGGRGK